MSVLVNFLDQTTQLLLDLDPDGKEKLVGLKGRIFCIKVTLPEITLYLVPDDHGLKLTSECVAEPDVTLTGPLTAFIRLAKSDSQSNVLTDGQISVHGSAEAGQALQNILSRLDIDWEELLSGFVGDTPARKIGNVVRDLSDWASESLDLSRTNAAEYFQEEKQWLITNPAVDRFRNNVDTLRADMDRIEQRINRLESLKNNSAKESAQEEP